jgi:hypothetical protein
MAHHHSRVGICARADRPITLTSPEGQKSLRHVLPPQLEQCSGLPEQPRSGGGGGPGGGGGGAGVGGGSGAGGGGLAFVRAGVVQHTLYWSLAPLL